MALLSDKNLQGKPAQQVTSYIAHLPPNLSSSVTQRRRGNVEVIYWVGRRSAVRNRDFKRIGQFRVCLYPVLPTYKLPVSLVALRHSFFQDLIHCPPKQGSALVIS